MKLSVILLWLLTVNQGCPSTDEGGQEPGDKVTEHFEVAYGDTLRYDLGFFGDEEGAFVFREPKYNALKGFCSDNREPLIYCYLPVSRTQGSDTIIFKLGYDSPGNAPVRRIEERKIIINLKQQ